MTTHPARWAPGAQATSHDAAPAPHRPITHTHSARYCPSCTAVLDGGPVQFWCEPCRRTVHAAALPHETTRPLVRRVAA